MSTPDILKRQYKRELGTLKRAIELELEALERDEYFEPSSGISGQCYQVLRINTKLEAVYNLQNKSREE